MLPTKRRRSINYVEASVCGAGDVLRDVTNDDTFMEVDKDKGAVRKSGVVKMEKPSNTFDYFQINNL